MNKTVKKLQLPYLNVVKNVHLDHYILCVVLLEWTLIVISEAIRKGLVIKVLDDSYKQAQYEKKKLNIVKTLQPFFHQIYDIDF